MRRGTRDAAVGGAAPWHRRATSAAAAIAVPVLVVVLALVNQGFPLARLDLNDGAVWLTATSQLRLGRYNAQIDELNAGLVAKSADFDVLQDAGDVVLVERGTISVVDPRSVSLGAQLDAPGADVSMAAGTIAITTPDGGLYVRSLASLEGLRVGQDPPDVELGRGGRAVVARTGAVLAVGADGAFTRVTLAGTAPQVEAGGSLGVGAAEQLSAVGDEPVVLRGSTLTTRGGSIELPGDGLVLQQAGPASARALVSSTSALLEAPLDGGAVREHRTGGSGVPAAPVQVGKCAQGAWATGVGSHVLLCDGAAPRVQNLEDMSTSDVLVFRVNRSVVVLNDTRRGRVWEPLEDTDLRVPNWEDIEDQDQPEDEQEDTDSPDTSQDLVTDCSQESSAPKAMDDDFGVRPGRTTVLPVISNDSSSDCGILVVREFEPIPEAFGSVQSIQGGRALQVAVEPDAVGAVEFRYTIDDGRGVNAPSTATVTLRAHPEGENSPPVELRHGTFEVEQGGQSTYNALANFVDPDGDDLVLVGATADPAAGSARYRQDGTVTFRADGSRLGRTRVTVLVSDGSDEPPTEGALEVDVRPEGSIPPRIDPVHAVTYVDQPVTLSPLAAVRSSSKEPVRLAAVEDVAGATVTPDLQGGTFAFTSPREGSYYVRFTVAAPPQQATGLARVDVLPWPDEAQPPVAVRDRAFLPAGGQVTVDPLANDTDPAGSVLVLQSVDASLAPGLTVAILDHHLVQIRSEQTLTETVVLRYTVSNGAAASVGDIVVQPVPPSASTQPPIVENIEVSVRTGGVVTIPVLDHAYDPDGDELTLVRDLREPLARGQGLLFVSGDLLRYQAPAQPMTVRTVFDVVDSTGNKTGGTLTVRVHESDADSKSPPRPKDLEARVFAGEKVRIAIPLVGIDPDGDGVSLLGVAHAPAKGFVVKTGADWIEYQALPGELGTDTFQYAVEDWVGQRAVATVRVGISPRPTGAANVVAVDDEVTIKVGERIEARVLANDIDSSGDRLQLAEDLVVDEGVDARVEGRRVVVQAPDQPGVLRIGYTATNARGGRDSAILTVTVLDEVDVLPPIAQDVVVPAAETLDLTEVAVDVLTVAQNPSGPISNLRVAVPQSVGQVARVDESGRVIVALAKQNQTLPYYLYNVRAPEVWSYAFITVPPLAYFPPTPRPGAPALRVGSGDELRISLSEQLQVAAGREASAADPTALSATKGTATVAQGDAGTIVYKSANGYAGPASVSLPVTDRLNAGDTGARTAYITLPIEVFAVDDHPPTFTPSTIDVPPGEAPVVVDLRVFTTGPEGVTPTDDRYRYTIASAVPAGFTATITDSLLSVSAAATTAKGQSGKLGVRIAFGRAGTLETSLDLRVIASTRQTARVLDRTIVDGVEGQASTVDVLTDAFNPFAPQALRVVGAVVETPDAGTVSATATTVSVRPAVGFIGQMVTRFRVRDVTDDPSREVEGRIYLTVRGKPATPTTPLISAERDTAVVLDWVAPDNRGAPITEYRVTAQPGGIVRMCASTTCTIDKLTNDVQYTFTVAARNAVGYSDESPASRPARPDAVPEPPGKIDFVGFGDGTLTWSWPPSATTGSAVTGYDVTITPAPPGGPATRTVTTPRVTFDGLENGTAYSIQVRARNKAPEPSAWSPSSATQVPARAPDAPTRLVAQREDTPVGGVINATWSAPPSDGGAAIDRYTITVSAPGDAPGAGTFTVQPGAAGQTVRYQLANARNGTAYTFAVTAHNKAGDGAAATVAASTYGLPGTPTATASAPPGEGAAVVQWGAVDDNGAPVTYEVLDGAGRVLKSGVRGVSTQIGGLDGGTPVTLRVRAVNAAGPGDPSAPVTVTPTTRPSRVDGLVVRANGSGAPTALSGSWDPPASVGSSSAVTYSWTIEVTGPGGWSSSGETTARSVEAAVPGGFDWSWTGENVRLTVLPMTVVAGTTLTATSASSVTTLVGAWGRAPGVVPDVTLVPDATTDPTSVTGSWRAPSSNLAITGYRYCVALDGRCGSWQELGGTTATFTPAEALGAVPPGDHTLQLLVQAANASNWGEAGRSAVVTVTFTDPGGGG